MTVLLGMIWLLNAGDLLLTRVALTSRGAWEANAVMQYFFEQGTLAGAAFKIVIVTVGVAGLWLLRRRTVVFYASAALALAFVCLVTYELLWVLA